MSARWEPLETAEEVVAAHQAKRRIEIGSEQFGWSMIEKYEQLDVYDVETDMLAGWKFRAMIKGSK